MGDWVLWVVEWYTRQEMAIAWTRYECRVLGLQWHSFVPFHLLLNICALGRVRIRLLHDSCHSLVLGYGRSCWRYQYSDSQPARRARRPGAHHLLAVCDGRSRLHIWASHVREHRFALGLQQSLRRRSLQPTTWVQLRAKCGCGWNSSIVHHLWSLADLRRAVQQSSLLVPTWHGADIRAEALEKRRCRCRPEHRADELVSSLVEDVNRHACTLRCCRERHCTVCWAPVATHKILQPSGSPSMSGKSGSCWSWLLALLLLLLLAEGWKSPCLARAFSCCWNVARCM